MRPGLFPPSHIRASGVSVIRTALVDVTELEKQGNAIASTSSEAQTFAGVRLCSVQDLRSCLKDQEREFCVFDDPVKADGALPANPAHAIAIATSHLSEDEVLRLQLVLNRMFGPLLSATAVYQEV